MPDLPGPLRLTSTFPFVGRAAELETLRTLMPRAEGEGRRVVLLGGEPGSGKSRLVREFAARGRRATARSSSTAPATRSCARRTGRSSRRSTTSRGPPSPTSCARRSAPAAASSRACCPTCRARIGELPPPVEADPDTERHRLHTAVTELLAGVTPPAAGAARARGRPLGRRADAPAPAPPDARGRARARAGARHVPRHRGRRARARSRRRSPTCGAPTTSSGCGSPGSPATRSPSSSAAPPAASSAPSCASSRRRSTTSPRATPFLVCELWRALVETGAVEIVGGRSGSPGRRRDRHARERARGRQPAARAPRAGDDGPARARGDGRARSSSSTSSARAAGLGEPELLAALDEAVRSGMLEELPSHGARVPLHARARAARAVRPALRACAAPSCTCASARRSRAPAGAPAARSPTSRTTSPPPAPLGGAERGVEYNVLAARAAVRGARLRRGGGAAAHRARARHRRARASARRCCSSSATRATAAGKALDALRGVPGGGATSPASSATRELLARAAIGYEDACWRPGIADQGAVELLEEAADGARRRRLGAARRAARRPRARARLPGRPRARRDRPRERDRDGARSSATGSGSRRC